MSRPVDEKIAKMSLDNADFKAKAAETVSIFGKLTSTFSKFKPIDMSKSVKSIGDIQGAVDKTNLSKLSEGVGNIASKFTTMGMVAVGVLTNIASKAVSAGLNMAKSFTLQPLTDGFSEYENKMKSIQVIMSNTMGKSSLQDVTDSLQDLNLYADKTIYSFADMTSNMGTFTAAGVGLKDAQTAIKGISNLAATSGSNTQQASTAMYQLSQAISTGKVGLQDWNSVVNAGMGGKLFQEALQKTAVGMGKNIDGAKSFRDSLADGWLTSDVLLQTLNEFSTNESMLEAATKVRTFTQLVDTAKEAVGSGWASTWEIVFGNFEEAGAMWTKAGEAIIGPINASAQARNKMLQDFVKLGGRAALVNAVGNTFKGLSQILGSVKAGFSSVFPPATGQALTNIAKGIEDFSKKLLLSEKGLATVQKISQGFFSGISAGISVIKSVGSAISDMIPDSAGGDIVGLAVKLADMLIGFKESMDAGNGFKDALSGISGMVKSVATVIWDVASAVTGFALGLGGSFGKITNIIGPVVDKVAGFMSKLVKSLDIEDILNVGLIASLIGGIKKFDKLQDSMGGFLDGFSDMFGTVKEAVGGLGGITDALKSLTDNVKAKTLVAIAIAVGLLAGSIKLIAGVDAQDVAKSLEVLALTLGGLLGALNLIGKMDFTGGSSLKASAILIALSGAVMNMALALKVLSTINPGEMASSLAALVVIVGALVLAINSISKNNSKMMTSSVGMLALSASVVILASAVEKLSTINASSLLKAVGALGVIFAELAVFLKIVDGTKLSPASGAAMLIISGAILVMVEGIRQIADIKVDDLVKGLVTIGLIMTAMAAFVKVTGGSKVMGAAVGMVAVAGAINMLVPPIQKFASMDINQLAQGLGALGVVLLEVVVALKLASGSGGGAASIVAVAVAIGILVPPLIALSNLTFPQIAAGLVALGGAFAVIGVAAVVLGPLTPVILAFSAAIGVVGIAFGAVGLAMAGFAAAVSVLAGVGVAGIAAVVGALGLLLAGLITLIPQMVKFGVTAVTELAKGIAQAAPSIANSALTLILGLLTALRDNVPQIATVGMELITALMNSLSENLPPLIEAGAEMIISFIDGLANTLRDNDEQMVSAMLNIMEAMLEAMITGLQAILDVMFGWIPGFEGTSKKLGDAAKKGLQDTFNVGDVSAIGSKGGKGFTDGVGTNSGAANTQGTNLGTQAKTGAGSISLNSTGVGLGAGLVTGIGSKQGAAKTTGTSLGNNAKSGAGGVSLNATGSNLGQGFATGLGGKTVSAGGAGRSIANAGKSGTEGVDFSSSGSYAGEGFAQGIEGKRGRVSSAAEGLASMAKGALEKLLKIFSPSRVMREDGGYFGEGFALGIDDKAKMVADKATNMATGAVTAVKGYADKFTGLITDGMDLQPVITPVLDIANLKNFNLPTGYNIPVDVNGAGGLGGTNYYDITIVTQSQDPATIAREVEKIIVRGVQS